MFIGRINLKYIFSLVAVGVTMLSIFIAIGLSVQETKTSEDNSALTNRVITWKNRITNFSDGSAQANYQAEQSKIAIATGGVMGKGPGRSTQRNFLPQSYSDFIFATVIEEYGIIGGTFTLLLYLILLYRGVLIAKNAPRTFGSLLAIGLSFSLVFQAMINMAVAVNLFPVTGQPLPMVSMGGTSIWFTCLAVGIILSVSRNTENENMEVSNG
jgi:cell division protein FtsW